MSVYQTKSFEELEAEAEKFRREVYTFSEAEDVMGLSKSLTDLANVNASIGSILNALRQEKSTLENDLKNNRETIKSEMMKGGMSAAQAESEKFVQTKTESDIYVKIYNEYSQVRDYHEDIKQVLELGRTRNSTLRTGMELS